MSRDSDQKAYKAEAITVTFEARRCLHAAECVRGLPGVFDTAKRPWVQPDNATADQLAEVVRRCPSGALKYALADGAEETPNTPTTITRNANGQLTVRGELRVDTPQGPAAETRVVLCGCGNSQLQPFCDHTGLCGR
ncbi:(4Fe-4S)-binding protein [Streptomyces sp. NPDC058459]|uniref:(4Fe-4S)-binding protein n=1 Tax=Streptomyces sp. NPDC058459 TaxID=3346508 RepID=UPI0036510F35